MNRVHYFGFGLLLSVASAAPVSSMGQATPPAGVPELPALPQAGGPAVGGTTNGAVSSFSGQKVRPIHEGPLHEAFLSPRKDRNPVRVEKAPPPPMSERPGVDPPSATAEWIEGYWEWDPGRNDFVWVTGTWRVPPPGRFWVNGYWKRDDKGWYRVPGFWSERKTDRLDYRKDGPPQDHPDDEPGDPPNSECFYVPGQYHPDGDGVVWRKGYWTKTQPGWSWVPAQWVRQPDGWMFQDGYWDRTLEDRGILFTPAEVDKGARGADDLTYQPYSKVAPEMYGQLNGAFGRPNSNYDGYPGVYYDDSGRYYGYASYGYLNGYYGYLDYPYYGGYGYPYDATPVQYGMGGGYGGYGDPYGGYGAYGGYPYGGYGGYGLYGGLMGGGLGFGLGGYGGYGGLGYGFGGFGYPYPYGFGFGGFGGFGFGGFGFGFPGFGFGFGFPGFGFGFGFPFFGFGFGGFGGFGGLGAVADGVDGAVAAGVDGAVAAS